MSAKILALDEQRKQQGVSYIRTLLAHCCTLPRDIPASDAREMRVELLDAIDKIQRLTGVIEYGVEQIEALEADLGETQTELDILREKNGFVCARLNRLQGDYDVLQDKYEHISKERKRLEGLATVQEHERAQQRSASDLAVAQQRIRELESALQKCANELHAAQEYSRDLEGRMQLVQQAESAAAAQAQAAVSERAQADAELAVARSTIEALRRQLAASDAEGKRTAAELQAARALVLELQGSCDTAVARERQSSASRLRHASAERVRLQLRVASLRGELSRVKSEQAAATDGGAALPACVSRAVHQVHGRQGGSKQLQTAHFSRRSYAAGAAYVCASARRPRTGHSNVIWDGDVSDSDITPTARRRDSPQRRRALLELKDSAVHTRSEMSAEPAAVQGEQTAEKQRTFIQIPQASSPPAIQVVSQAESILPAQPAAGDDAAGSVSHTVTDAQQDLDHYSTATGAAATLTVQPVTPYGRGGLASPVSMDSESPVTAAWAASLGSPRSAATPDRRDTGEPSVDEHRQPQHKEQQDQQAPVTPASTGITLQLLAESSPSSLPTPIVVRQLAAAGGLSQPPAPQHSLHIRVPQTVGTSAAAVPQQQQQQGTHSHAHTHPHTHPHPHSQPQAVVSHVVTLPTVWPRPPVQPAPSTRRYHRLRAADLPGHLQQGLHSPGPDERGSDGQS